jgi:hypothetical protein
MGSSVRRVGWAATLVGVLACASAAMAAALGTGFTYQGVLKDGGAAFDGNIPMTFRLFDAATSPPGVQIGGNDVFASVTVTNGLFTVTLNAANQFGASAFTGDARWLRASR